MKGWQRTVSAGAITSLVAAVSAGAQAPTPPAPAQPAPTRAVAAQPASAGLTRIAFVDVQRVLARSAAGASAREQLERERAGMQKEFEAKKQELEKLRDELDKKGPLLTAEARQEKQDAYERKRRDAARLADDFQKEIEKKEQGLLQKVLHDLSGVIQKVAKDRGYTLVLERRAGLLYADASVDLTDEIIRMYDQESAPKGKK